MTTIYHAAGLFNSPDQIYNLLLTEKLENKWYKVILPQRDGFEFSKLASNLEKILPKEQVPNAVNRIIYFLDKGKFIGQDSNFCIARLDEPIDEGVVNEIDFCNMVKIPVIGFRTDVRSPYGNSNNEVCGAHFFPPYSCNKFILIPPNFRNIKQANEQLDILFLEIDHYIQNNLISKSNSIDKNSFAYEIISMSKNLFNRIKDLHSKQGLFEISKRYDYYKEKIDKIIPEIVRI